MFKIVSSQDELLKTFVVRSIVFIEEQNCPYELEVDEFEHSALHILGEKENEPIAVARIRFFAEYAKLERIAIRKKWRGGGLGDQLIDFMLLVCRERGYKSFKMHAQSHLEKFYNKHGFTSYGEPFMEAGIEHLMMVCTDK